MTGMNEPDRNFRPGPDPEFRPDENAGFGQDAEVANTPRRSRQPVLTVVALLGIILLVLALVIFGGM